MSILITYKLYIKLAEGTSGLNPVFGVTERRVAESMR